MIGKVERKALRDVTFVVVCGLVLACKPEKQAVSATQQSSVATPGSADAYRGVKWGASEAEAKRIIQFNECSTPELDPLFKLPRYYCTSHFKIGDVEVDDEFDFFAGHFLSGGGTFSHEEFNSVREAFVAKYGHPKFETSDGLVWQFDGNEVMLSHELSGSGLGNYGINSREFTELYEKAKAEKASEAGKAL